MVMEVSSLVGDELGTNTKHTALFLAAIGVRGLPRGLA